MGDGNPRQQRRRNRARDAGNDLARYARGGKRQRLFPTASKHEGIAALEPDNAMPASCLANHQPIDGILADRRTAGAFSDKESACARSKTKGLWIEQRVIQNEVGVLEPLDGPERQQLRITRTSADQ